MTQDATPLDALHAAVQDFSNALADDRDEVAITTQALVVWEEMNFSEDGTRQYQILYAATGEANPSRSIGLAYHLLKNLQHDIVGCDRGED